ncbi:MAG: hypothetical protein Kow0013_24890 [Pararhodobacter sp.]
MTIVDTTPQPFGAIARSRREDPGHPPETALLDHGAALTSPEHLAIRPRGKVPAITDDGRIVTEGAALGAPLARRAYRPAPGRAQQILGHTAWSA